MTHLPTEHKLAAKGKEIENVIESVNAKEIVNVLGIENVNENVKVEAVNDHKAPMIRVEIGKCK